MRAHKYRGYTIYPCGRTSLGRCDHRGRHVQTQHGATGINWAEEECPRFATLREAQEWIDRQMPDAGRASGSG